VSHLLELVEEADRNKDGKIDFDEWEIMGKQTIAILCTTDSSPYTTSQTHQEKNTHGCYSP
jgi:EF hand